MARYAESDILNKAFNGTALLTGGGYTKATAVTKSDSTVLTGVRALYIGATGHLSLVLSGDTDAVTFKDVPTGTLLEVCAKKVMAATTATDIVALY